MLQHFGVHVMIEVLFDSRFERKAGFFEGRLLKKLVEKLEQLKVMDMHLLLRDSYAIKGVSGTENVLVTKVSNDYRLIFRRIGPDSIEVMDIVSHEDIDKFSRRGR